MKNATGTNKKEIKDIVIFYIESLCMGVKGLNNIMGTLKLNYEINRTTCSEKKIT